MTRIFRWLTPALALGAMALFFNGRATADDAAPAKTTGSVTVTVQDKDGKAVPDAEVVILPHHAHHGHDAAPAGDARPPEGGVEGEKHHGDARPPEGGVEGEKHHGDHARPEPVAKGQTNSDGVVTLTDIPEGEYAVHAMLHDVGAGHGKVTVKGGETATLTIHLEHHEGRHGHGRHHPGGEGEGATPPAGGDPAK